MSQVLFDLEDKTAIITGGGSGIGAGIARAYGALGANLVIADVELETSEEVVAELEAAGYPVLLLQVDVRFEDQVEAMVQQATNSFGSVDILVNSAGVGTLSSIVDMLEEEWDWVLDVNLKGPFLCTRAVARRWIQTGRGGRIINLSFRIDGNSEALYRTITDYSSIIKMRCYRNCCCYRYCTRIGCSKCCNITGTT